MLSDGGLSGVFLMLNNGQLEQLHVDVRSCMQFVVMGREKEDGGIRLELRLYGPASDLQVFAMCDEATLLDVGVSTDEQLGHSWILGRSFCAR